MTTVLSPILELALKYFSTINQRNRPRVKCRNPAEMEIFLAFFATSLGMVEKLF